MSDDNQPIIMTASEFDKYADKVFMESFHDLIEPRKEKRIRDDLFHVVEILLEDIGAIDGDGELDQDILCDRFNTNTVFFILDTYKLARNSDE